MPTYFGIEHKTRIPYSNFTNDTLSKDYKWVTNLLDEDIKTYKDIVRTYGEENVKVTLFTFDTEGKYIKRTVGVYVRKTAFGKGGETCQSYTIVW